MFEDYTPSLSTLMIIAEWEKQGASAHPRWTSSLSGEKETMLYIGHKPLGGIAKVFVGDVLTEIFPAWRAAGVRIDNNQLEFDRLGVFETEDDARKAVENYAGVTIENSHA